ncbi:MAG: outer membrane protein assembly factor BamD [candidate division Zixibacteria bacterium]|nr:outer membrane protein assembly factor BamD [candidate division Zixibacteria bacterium]
MARNMFAKRILLLSAVIASFSILAGCGGSNVKPVLDAEDQLKLATQLYEDGKYLKAESEFQRFIYNYPGNNAVDTAQFYLAMSYYMDKDYTLAAGEFNKVLTLFPSSEFADDSQYRLAMCHYHQSPHFALDQTDTEIAIENFMTFLDYYPFSEHADSANVYLTEMRDKLAKKAFRTARLYQKLKRFEPAVIYYDKVIDLYPESPYVPESVYRKAECYLELEQYEDARQALFEFIDTFKDHEFYKEATEKLRKLEDLPRAEG